VRPIALLEGRDVGGAERFFLEEPDALSGAEVAGFVELVEVVGRGEVVRGVAEAPGGTFGPGRQGWGPVVAEAVAMSVPALRLGASGFTCDRAWARCGRGRSSRPRTAET
jgi:hypothetical protein